MMAKEIHINQMYCEDKKDIEWVIPFHEIATTIISLIQYFKFWIVTICKYFPLSKKQIHY